jgi:hypothetical protein
MLACWSQAPVAIAQPETLTGVVLRASGPGQRVASTPLVRGVQVDSTGNGWTEVTFADGTTVVLEAGADFTLRRTARDPGTDRIVIEADSARGRLRVSTSNNVELRLRIQANEVRFVAASALVQVEKECGSVTFLSGQRVALRQSNGGEKTLQRSAFAMALCDGTTTQQTRAVLTESLSTAASNGGVAQSRDASGAGSSQGLSTVPVGASNPSSRVDTNYWGTGGWGTVTTTGPQPPITTPQSPITTPQSPITTPQSPITTPQSPITTPQSPITVAPPSVTPGIGGRGCAPACVAVNPIQHNPTIKPVFPGLNGLGVQAPIVSGLKAQATTGVANGIKAQAPVGVVNGLRAQAPIGLTARTSPLTVQRQ